VKKKALTKTLLLMAVAMRPADCSFPTSDGSRQQGGLELTSPVICLPAVDLVTLFVNASLATMKVLSGERQTNNAQ
jgi:hypothetical protein